MAAAGWMAAHTGDADTAKAMLKAVANDASLATYPANAAMVRALDAELALLSKDPARALMLLQPSVDAGSGSYFERAVLMRAQLAVGNREAAETLAHWLATNRGRAFAESNSLGLWQAANLIEANLALRAKARLVASRGSKGQAEDADKAFDSAWPGGGELALVKRRDAAF